MRLYSLILALFVFISGSAWADAPRSPLSKEATGTYEVDKAHANIIFSIEHLGFSDYMGRFNSFDASLKLDAANPAKSSLNVTVTPASIDTNNTELENKLRGSDYFNVSKFPAITFTSTSIKLTSAKRGTVTGNLTMLGVTKPVTLNVQLNKAGYNNYASVYDVGFSATATIKRSDWGMTMLVPQVSDEVNLIISAEFHKKG